MISWFLSDQARSLFERLYFLSGIVLAGSLLAAIWQIRLQRQISKIGAKREAYRIAAERCDYFGREILALQIDLKKTFESSGCGLIKKCKIEVKDGSITIDPTGLTPKDAESANAHTDKMTKLTNSLEGFAVFFVTGVADDNIGFLICGRAFVSLFEEYFPLWALSDSLDNHAQATQALYARWKARITQIELVAKQTEISKKLDPKKQKPKLPLGA